MQQDLRWMLTRYGVGRKSKKGGPKTALSLSIRQMPGSIIP